MPYNEDPNPQPERHLRLVTLGSAELVALRPDGTSSRVFGPGKPLALLVYLAKSPGRAARREHLVDLLWSDLPPNSADHAFRQTVWLIRRHVGQEGLIGENGILRLGAVIESDRDAFIAAADAGEFERAVDLYGGDFLGALAMPGGAGFEQWAHAERYRLQLLFIRCAEVVVRQRLGSGHCRDAERLARRMRDTAKANESVWRLLIETCLCANDLVSARVEADALEQLLRERNREPEPATAEFLRRARSVTGQTPDSEVEPATIAAELIGREQQFALLLEEWGRVSAGGSGHVHITSPPGLGKTRLLRDFHARLRATGARAVLVRAHPGERDIPYSFAGDLAGELGALPGAAGVSPASIASLLALHPPLTAQFTSKHSESRGAEERLRQRTLALVETLAAIAENRPLAVLIDDLHWADGPSRQLMRNLLNRLGENAVLIVTTERPTARLDVCHGDSMRLELPPLTPNEVAALVMSIAPLPEESWAERFPDALHEATDGSPLLVLETLQWATENRGLERTESGWHCVDSVSLHRALMEGEARRHRIIQLDERQRSALLLLAVAGTSLPLSLLARAHKNTVGTTQEGLTKLEQRGFVARAGDEWELTHDEVAELALALADADTLKSAHEAMGTALTEEAAAELHLLTRAGRHFVHAAAPHRLQETYRRMVRAARQGSDRRNLHELAEELVGPDAEPNEAAHLVRTLPAFTRYRFDTRPVQLGTAAALIVATAGLSLTISQPPSPPPDAVLVAVAAETSDRSVTYAVPLFREGWETVDAVDFDEAEVHETPIEQLAWLLGKPHPDGRRWAVSFVAPDTGGAEIYLVQPGSEPERLTFARGDDRHPDWSPDGRMLVFSTARWNPQSWNDIALLDVTTGAVSEVTRSDTRDITPIWSPDGTRIAYHRFHAATDGRKEICVFRLDGVPIRCLNGAGGVELEYPLAWHDTEQLIATAHIDDQKVIIRLNVTTGDHVVVKPDPYGVTVSPDGRWIACRCQQAGRLTAAWQVFPTDRPDLATPLSFPQGVTGATPTWGASPRSEPYIDLLKVRPVSQAIALDASFRLVAEAFDEAGASITVLPQVLRWETNDSSVASIDSAGLVTPHREGSVVVSLSGGGWRRDSTIITIGPRASSLAFREDWLAGLDESWTPFGIPTPTITVGPDDLAAFWNRGDSAHYSGAYSQQMYDASRGLGMELQMSAPITDVHWQLVSAALSADWESAWLTEWDHETGRPPFPYGGALRSCAATYPAGEGPQASEAIQLQAMDLVRTVRLHDPLDDGEWFTVRVQIFADGRCGFALNGTALWVAPNDLDRTKPFRILLRGQSVRTRMLIGPLEVWEGVRGDVDWKGWER